MRRPLAIAAIAGTVLAGGTAIAVAGGGPLGGVFGDRQDRDAELARELAQRLDGVEPEEVERALDDLREDKRAEWRKQQAAALAKHLDGVSAADVEKALEKVEQDARRDRSRGEWQHPGDYLGALAKELGKSESELRKAFRAAHREQLNAKLDEAVKEGRLTEKQADRIRKHLRNGRPFLHKRLHRGDRGHHPGKPGFGMPGIAPPGAPPRSQ